jgi:hypothetical protein
LNGSDLPKSFHREDGNTSRITKLTERKMKYYQTFETTSNGSRTGKGFGYSFRQEFALLVEGNEV